MREEQSEDKIDGSLGVLVFGVREFWKDSVDS